MTAMTLPLSPDHPQGNLRCQTVGWINLHSGRLLVGDPFQGLTTRSTSTVALLPGCYRVVRTLEQVDEGRDLPVFVSLIVDEALLRRRQDWQVKRLDLDGDDRWPEHAISEAGEDEDGNEAPFLIQSPSGCVGMVDASSFAAGMPPDSEEPGGSWYDRLFEHGRQDSWFDQMDADDEAGAEAALIALPHAAGHLAVAQGVSGQKRLFLEHAFVRPTSTEDADEMDELLAEIISNEKPVIALHIALR